jgi:hypothetical protein
MSISKAHWDTNGEDVRLSMPFSKVDQERRIVSGFATLDNIDRQADIVTTDASLKAFAAFRGNIREMHQPKAVGKMVSFKEDKYFDPESKKFYSGVYVSAYVSKGAQDTWEKVLDGTYTGFSIGGKMKEWDDSYDEKMDAPIRIIKDYDLMELSLVDSPANQFASIISIEKVDGVDVIKGDSVDVVVENVFWDKENGLVTLSEESSVTSPITGTVMQNIGFVEKSDDDKLNMIKFLVDSAKGINVTKMNKENDNMTDEIVNDEVVEVAPEADAVLEAPVTEVVVEEPVQVESEPTPVEEVVEEPVVDVVAEAVTDIKGLLTSAFSDLTAIVKSLSDEIVELKKSVGMVDAKIADAEGDFGNLGKRIDAVEADTAFRKSGDLGQIIQEPAMVEKSLWGGSFLTTSNLLN